MSCDAILTVDQMRSAEQAAMAGGTGDWELMQRAGKGAAQWVSRMAGGRAVAVLCGPGNNGGDGYVIAESLRTAGKPVIVVAPTPPSTETARKAAQCYGGEVATSGMAGAPVIVDCLFGYGLSRQVEGPFAQLLEDLATAQAYKIAIDVPSSIASDSGESLGPCGEYDLTLALGAWKQAHFSMPAMARMGVKRLVDIGLEMPSGVPRLSHAPRLHPPAATAHKYKRGLLAVVAGAMPGAPILAAEAAMRAGAGYVKLLSEHSHPDAPVDLVIEEAPLGSALDDERTAAVLIGPGLGRDDAARQRLSAVLNAGHRAIVDADALHLLDPDMLENCDARRIAVTPHEGELAALCDAFAVADGSKAERARALHRASGLTVLAKGPDTVLAGEDGVRMFPRGSSWLSVAGSGDVLAGIAASRLASHGDGFRACEEAVWLHREAAILCAKPFTASDLAHTVSSAVRAFL